MKIINFPYLAMLLGVVLMYIIKTGSNTNANGELVLPLLTLLVLNECAFILCAIGSYLGLRNIRHKGMNQKQRLFYAITTAICILLTIQFTILAVKLWPL